jgi:hypothetical protein
VIRPAPLPAIENDSCRHASEYRNLYSGEITLPELSRESFFLIPPNSTFAHWITPEVTPCASTRDFVACHPAGQEASLTSRNGGWHMDQPKRSARQEHGRHRATSPPTLKTLAMSPALIRWSVSSTLAGANENPTCSPLPTVREEHVLIYPWDPEYEAYRLGKADSTCPMAPFRRLPTTRPGSSSGKDVGSVRQEKLTHHSAFPCYNYLKVFRARCLL